jgi:hypothetical protein
LDIKNLPLLRIHQLSKAQYERELEANRIEENALYLMPDEDRDLDGYATEEYVDTAIQNAQLADKDIDLTNYYTKQETEALIPDTSSHVQNSDMHVTSADKQKWNAKSNFSGDYNDLTNAPAIAEDETGDLVIADNAGNIIFRASDQGLETTHLSIGSLTINGMTIQEMIKAYVDEAILGGEW